MRKPQKRGGWILELCLKIRISLFQARLCEPWTEFGAGPSFLLLPLPRAPASCWSLDASEATDITRKVTSEKRRYIVSGIMTYLEG